ncbi:hypothetical protein VVD49_06705 [Uliginosibacterium sp. H3]|uniref:Hemerythrin-like domain-containing protein n=1 Tax=Uliginosibacterium silvisoli TaxID=3114758 RepID=A0ABU6K164_9RHOO|nr:hypothetical protein [Uliginosibacterium sp. H3]
MQSANQRYNIYGTVHKGLRTFMSDTLQRCGRTDWQDPADSAQSLAQLRMLMEVCHSHLQHEDAFVHAAMDARRPGSSNTTLTDHHEHVLAIKSILADIAEIEKSLPFLRDVMGSALYRRLALFVAENFEHMAVEETDNNAVLWACYSDAEILAIEHALVASLPPEKKMGFMRWILPSVSAGERAQMLCGMRQGVPAEAFDGVLAMLRPLISGNDWDKLMRALGCGELSAA